MPSSTMPSCSCGWLCSGTSAPGSKRMRLSMAPAPKSGCPVTPAASSKARTASSRTNCGSMGLDYRRSHGVRRPRHEGNSEKQAMSLVRSDLPSGTVTFLFTDVEGSTRLLHELGSEGYAVALAEHRRTVRAAFTRHGGVEVDTQGDAFFVAFPTAPEALAAAREMLAGHASGPVRVRMGLHTGTPFLTEEGYVGPDVNRAARISAAGHGGQVLVSASTASLLGTDG